MINPASLTSAPHLNLSMTSLTPSLLPALLLAALTTPVLAQSQIPPSQGGSVQAAQREAFLRARVDLERRSHAGRIAILQEADRCIAAAATMAAYRACERQEKEARQQFRSQMQAEIQAFRARFGLPPRQGSGGGSISPQGATL